MQDPKEGSTSGACFFVRIYWMFVGPVLLFFLLVFMFEKRPPFPSLFDAAYLITVVSLPVLRYIDVRFLDGQTGEGQPATMTHWRRYAIILGSLGVAAWMVSRAVLHFLK